MTILTFKSTDIPVICWGWKFEGHKVCDTTKCMYWVHENWTAKNISDSKVPVDNTEQITKIFHIQLLVYKKYKPKLSGSPMLNPWSWVMWSNISALKQTYKKIYACTSSQFHVNVHMYIIIAIFIIFPSDLFPEKCSRQNKHVRLKVSSSLSFCCCARTFSWHERVTIIYLNSPENGLK